MTSKKNGRWPQKKWKWKMTSILRQSYWDYLTTKTSKTNGFDTIENDLVHWLLLGLRHKNAQWLLSPCQTNIITNSLQNYFASYPFKFYPAWVKLLSGCYNVTFPYCCCSRQWKDDIFYMDLVFKITSYGISLFIL